MLVEHYGDTRGNEFYTEVLCIAADGTAFPARNLLQGQRWGAWPGAECDQDVALVYFCDLLYLPMIFAVPF